MRNIVLDVFDEKKMPRRRIRLHPKVNLSEAVSSFPSAWSRARALALWKAEQLRANNSSLNLARASAGFEKNPFKWRAEFGWLSQIKIAFLWSWFDGGECFAISFVSALHLLRHSRNIPRPPALRSPDALIWDKLLLVCEKECLLKYLGVWTPRGYEPDPARWAAGEKTDEKVWYEWQEVFRGDQKVPHRVSIRVRDVVNAGRTPPHNPLVQSAPLDLYFTVGYMQAFAQWKSPGSEYVGISYEGDQPAFQFDVPDGGLDIQDQCVYWNLLTGTECLSLRELHVRTDDQLVPSVPGDIAYILIGEEMKWEILGVCANEADIAQYLSEPGALADERWKQLSWEEPERETVPCWWIVFSGQTISPRVCACLLRDIQTRLRHAL